jgi:AcrR family transcriptional regulator
MHKAGAKIKGKERILSEAQRLFSSKGYKSTTLEDISSKLGVTKPSLYYYFKNKLEILTELHSKAFAELNENFTKAVELKESTKVKVRSLIWNHSYTVAKNSELIRIFYEQEREIPKRQLKKMRSMRKKYTEDIIALYEQGIKEGVFRKTDARETVYLILGTCNWICMWFRATKLSPEEISDLALKLLTCGYEV